MWGASGFPHCAPCASWTVPSLWPEARSGPTGTMDGSSVSAGWRGVEGLADELPAVPSPRRASPRAGSSGQRTVYINVGGARALCSLVCERRRQCRSTPDCVRVRGRAANSSSASSSATGGGSRCCRCAVGGRGRVVSGYGEASRAPPSHGEPGCSCRAACSICRGVSNSMSGWEYVSDSSPAPVTSLSASHEAVGAPSRAGFPVSGGSGYPCRVPFRFRASFRPWVRGRWFSFWGHVPEKVSCVRGLGGAFPGGGPWAGGADVGADRGAGGSTLVWWVEPVRGASGAVGVRVRRGPSGVRGSLGRRGNDWPDRSGRFAHPKYSVSNYF